MSRSLHRNCTPEFARCVLRSIPYASLVVLLLGCVGSDGGSPPQSHGSSQGGVAGAGKGSGGSGTSGGKSSRGNPGSGGLAGAASGGAPSENETAGAGGTLTGTGGGSSSAGAAGSAGTGTATTRPAEGKPACGTGTVGGDPGDVVGNFKLQDQNGNTVWLSDFCDKTIFIEGAAMWCPYCRAMAKELGKLYPKYKDRGFTVLTLLIENNDFESAVPPTTAELKEWADTFDLETPVLADPKGKIFDKLWRSGGLPMAKLLTPGAKIKIEDPDVSEVERHFDP